MERPVIHIVNNQAAITAFRNITDRNVLLIGRTGSGKGLLWEGEDYPCTSCVTEGYPTLLGSKGLKPSDYDDIYFLPYNAWLMFDLFEGQEQSVPLSSADIGDLNLIFDWVRTRKAA